MPLRWGVEGDQVVLYCIFFNLETTLFPSCSRQNRIFNWERRFGGGGLSRSNPSQINTIYLENRRKRNNTDSSWLLFDVNVGGS